MRINTSAASGGLRDRCVAAIVAKLDSNPELDVLAAARLVAVDTGNEAVALGWAPPIQRYLVQYVATVADELVTGGVRELTGAAA